MPLSKIDSDSLNTGAVTSTALAAGSVASAALASGVPTRAQLPAGSVLQVLQAVKTNIFSTATTGSWVDITDVSVSITPTSATSKVMVLFNVTFAPADTGGLRIVRNSTAIGVGDSLGSNTYQGTSSGIAVINGDKSAPTSGMYLDSPSTTSATTYKVQVWNYSGTSYINRPVNASNASYTGSSISTITVMEIAA
jgi:hypothetical protein